jgi:hypothetical protein
MSQFVIFVIVVGLGFGLLSWMGGVRRKIKGLNERAILLGQVITKQQEEINGLRENLGQWQEWTRTSVDSLSDQIDRAGEIEDARENGHS